MGSRAYDPEGIVQSNPALKEQAGREIVVGTDVCLCNTLPHGVTVELQEMDSL